MSARLFFPPVSRAFTTAGVPSAGELLYFYLTGGTTATPIYTTSALTTQHTNPVVADSAGRFPAIYLSDAISYRVVQKTAAGATVSDVDPYVMPVIQTTEAIQDIVGAMFANGANITAAYNDPAGTVDLAVDLSAAKPIEAMVIPITDTATLVAAGVKKFSFRAPFAMTLSSTIGLPRASLDTAQTGSGAGGLITVDINESGTSIISTKLTVDNGEKTSTTAATPCVISDTSIADDAEITIDVDTIGDGTAKGLNVTLLYRRT